MLKFESAAFEKTAALLSQLPPDDLPEVVFSGRSNVGKSSLINKILNRKALARVSATPGKTININFYKLNEARFADLPGYGYARVARGEKERWAQLIESFLGLERDTRLILQLVDMRHPPSKDDLIMIDYLCQMEKPFVVVLTKCDKLNQTQRAARLKALETEEFSFLENLTMIPFSAVTGEGAEEIRELIRAVTAPEEDQ